MMKTPRAVHHAFVLGLGARHGGIVKLSVVRCVTVFAYFTYLLTYLLRSSVSGKVIEGYGLLVRNPNTLRARAQQRKREDRSSDFLEV